MQTQCIKTQRTWRQTLAAWERYAVMALLYYPLHFVVGGIVAAVLLSYGAPVWFSVLAAVMISMKLKASNV